MSNHSNYAIFASGVVAGAALMATISALRTQRAPRLRTADDKDRGKDVIGADDGDDFQAAGRYLLEWLVQYRERTVHERPVISTVAANYLAPLLPSEAPCEEEYWPEIFKDIDSAIVPGLTNW